MPEYNSVYYAYFAPYSHQRHLEMIHKAQTSKQMVLENLGQTVEGRNIDLLVAGEIADSKPKFGLLVANTLANPWLNGLWRG